MLLDYIKHKIKEESLKTVKIKITMKYEALFVLNKINKVSLELVKYPCL